MQGQLIQILGAQVGAAKGLRQQTGRAGEQDRKCGADGPALQLSLRNLDLAGQTQLGVVVTRLAVAAVEGQQPGTGAIGAGVEFEAEHALGIQPEADGARGVARDELKDKALGPFPRGRLRRGAFVVAIEIIVTRSQGGLAVFDKTLRQQGRAEGAKRADCECLMNPFQSIHGVFPLYSCYEVGAGYSGACSRIHC
ncbi:hypothetical protein D3C84_850640 [compost metagenome]